MQQNLNFTYPLYNARMYRNKNLKIITTKSSEIKQQILGYVKEKTKMLKIINSVTLWSWSNVLDDNGLGGTQIIFDGCALKPLPISKDFSPSKNKTKQNRFDCFLFLFLFVCF